MNMNAQVEWVVTAKRVTMTNFWTPCAVDKAVHDNFMFIFKSEVDVKNYVRSAEQFNSKVPEAKGCIFRFFQITETKNSLMGSMNNIATNINLNSSSQLFPKGKSTWNDLKHIN